MQELGQTSEIQQLQQRLVDAGVSDDVVRCALRAVALRCLWREGEGPWACGQLCAARLGSESWG